MKIVIGEMGVQIAYKVQKEDCPCCGEPIKNSEPSEERKFGTTMEQIFSHIGWRDVEDIYLEEVEEMVEDYLFNTIRFYSVSGNENLIISPEEMKRVTELVKKEIEMILE